MYRERFFEFIGEPALTRGQYGVNVVGGHNTEEFPDDIFVHDPDFGDFCRDMIRNGIASGEWQEISREEWEALI